MARQAGWMPALACAAGLWGCGPRQMPEATLQTAQQILVSEDLVPAGVQGLVLGQMSRFPRHRILPKAVRPYSYNGGGLRLPDGTLAWPPSTLGRALQVLAPQPQEHALVIGVQDGWAAGLLAAAGLEVTLFDPQPERARLVRKALGRVELDGYDPEKIRAARKWEDVRAAGPFDCILVQGAVAEVLGDWTDRLAQEGGRLVAPEGLPGRIRLVRMVRTPAGLTAAAVSPGNFEPLYPERPVNYARLFVPPAEGSGHAPSPAAPPSR